MTLLQAILHPASPSLMQIIINADDLGMDTDRNDLVFDLMSEGRITSATILANGAGFEHAASNARRFSQCSFGVHLNATDFRPLREEPALRRLLRDGQFYRNIHSVRWDGSLCKGLYREFCAQMDRLLEAGIRVSHIDSHHHVHNLPPLFPVLKAIQQRYGIRRVRISQNIYRTAAGASWIHLAKKAAYNWALRHIYRTRTTEAFTEFQIFCELCKTARPGFRTVELMVHPGHPKYTAETDLLRRGCLEDLVGPVQKISYHDL